MPGLARSLRFYGFIVGLTLAHLVIDWGKLRLVRSNMIEDGAASFLGDQILHSLTICITVWLVARTPVSSLISKMRCFQSEIEKAASPASCIRWDYFWRRVHRSFSNETADEK
jgi:hypothetical protein